MKYCTKPEQIQKNTVEKQNKTRTNTTKYCTKPEQTQQNTVENQKKKQ